MKLATIDFWNTLYDNAGSTERNAKRREVLLEALQTAGHTCEPERFEAAYQGIWAFFDVHWLEHQRTPNSDEMVREILQQLQFELGEPAIASVAQHFADGVLDHPPALLPGVTEGLHYLDSQRIKLAIISDTAFSPGTVLRELMERDGIARYFSSYIFSDETGVAKPHADAFRLALEPFGVLPHEAFHIGDLERTDVAGARAAGMKAVLYRGDSAKHKYAEESTAADAVMDHWSEIAKVLEEITR